MSQKLSKIALGGGCHWCTEALFQSLRGVEKVEQGFIASNLKNNGYSEAVVVHYKDEYISLRNLIEIHLNTHQSTADHSMRKKYRSAIYTYHETQALEAEALLTALQPLFKNRIITKVLPFKDFRPSDKNFLNYYYSNPEKPFCKNYINPKLQFLLTRFSAVVDPEKIRKTKEFKH